MSARPSAAAGENHDVRDDACVEVDLAHEHQCRHEDEVGRQDPAWPVDGRDDREEGPHESLAHGIARTDVSAAGATAAAKQQPAHERDVVVGPDRRVARRAERATAGDADAARQPVRPRVDEAADEQAVDSGYDDDEGVHAQ